MIFLNLLLAHLLADFVFQPHKLVAWKFRSWMGTAAHAFVHFVVNLLLFYSYLDDVRVWGVLFCVALFHFAIDSTKIEEERHGRHFLTYFTADQMVHVAVLLGGAWVFSSFHQPIPIALWGNPLGEMFLVLGIIILVVLTYVVEIVQFQIQRAQKPSLVFQPHYQYMLQRAVIFSVIYVLIMVFGVYQAAAFGLFFR